MSVAIGIDLGTTFSCVAALVRDKIEIIANSEGKRTTPSCVAFTEELVRVGKYAVAQAPLNPGNTIFDVKRLMGKRFKDESVQKDAKHWPFRVVETSDGSAAVQVEYKGQTKQYSPEQISAMILGKMKDAAEAYLHANVDKAVITVPAYFNDGQRQATIDAAKIAGLEVLQLMNEPTAAALSFGVQRPSDELRKVLVFDFGGGTLDVSILHICGKQFEVLGTGGDSHLGGEDFVTALMEHCVDEFEKSNNLTVERTSKVLQELHEECEKAKKALTSGQGIQIEVTEFFDDIDLDVYVYRSKFETLCEPLFKRAISLVERTLAAADAMHKNEIDEVLLVGGSTRIPRMQKTLSDFFNGLDLSKSVPPDFAVAYGAAVQAAALSGNKSFGEVNLSDVIPLSLGTKNYDGSMAVVIERNSRIPASATEYDTTVADDQSQILFEVYEGEHALAEHNHFLGSFLLLGINPAPMATPEIDVTFTVDVNGVLHVTATDHETNNQSGMKLEFDKGRLSEAEIQRMIQEAEQFRDDERAVIERNQASHDLELYCVNVQQELSDERIKKELGADKVQAIHDICAEILAQLAKNRATKEEIDAWNQELTDLYGSLSARLSESSSSDAVSEAGSKRKAEPDSNGLATDINNAAAKIECDESANKRAKTEESDVNLSL